MKKINKYNFLVLISILIITSTLVVSTNLNSADEMWNFNFSRSLANGLLPYKDFSIIVPHLIYELPAIFLKIFSTELFIYRIFTIILATSTFYISYKILLELNVKKELSYLIVLILTIFNTALYYYEYNRFILLIILILLLLELKYIKSNKILKFDKKHDIKIGLLIGLTVLIKHTIGLVIIVGILGYKLLLVSSKKEFIEYLKIFLTRLTAILIPIILYILYLIYNNILNEFLDYTIYGISTFSNSLPFHTLINTQRSIMMKIFMGILLYLVPLTLIYTFIKGVIRKKRSKYNDINITLFAYATVSYSLFFPLTDLTHYQSASLVALIAVIYNLSKLKIPRKITEKINVNKIIKATTYICLATVLYITMSSSIKYINSYKSKLTNFKYIPIDQEYEKHITKVNDYINVKTKEGYTLYILDFRAVTHMIALDRYNKNYDMFNKGNFGKDGEDGIIEDIKDSDDKTLYLKTNWYVHQKYASSQNPEKVSMYIDQYYEKIDFINYFDVFERK